jgi:hypothetical protein
MQILYCDQVPHVSFSGVYNYVSNVWRDTSLRLRQDFWLPLRRSAVVRGRNGGSYQWGEDGCAATSQQQEDETARRGWSFGSSRYIFPILLGLGVSRFWDLEDWWAYFVDLDSIIIPLDLHYQSCPFPRECRKGDLKKPHISDGCKCHSSRFTDKFRF